MGENGQPERDDDGPSQHIETCTDLSAFFHETLTRALQSRQIRAPGLTEHYLVGLLAHLGHAEAPFEQSFVELELDARSGTRALRLSKLRVLGDRALSYSGLFDAHRERRGLGRDYVRRVGSRAYCAAGELASQSHESGARARADVFDELGRRFDTYAGVLEDVREATALGTPDDVLSLYERFAKTGSPALQRRLAEHGVLSLPLTEADS